jgi:O-antigen ligase/tetratricopeptide (TPR) repeat protein
MTQLRTDATSTTAAIQSYFRNSARGILLFSLVYVTWRFGGVDAVTLLHVSLMMLAACFLALLGQSKFGLRPTSLPLLWLMIIAGSVLWPLMQSMQLPQSVYNTVAPGQREIDTSLVDRCLAGTFPILRPTLDATFESVSESRHQRRSISVVQSLTDARINQWLLMSAYVFVCGLLFNTRKSRRIFLWTLATNAALIAAWGLIQRATGTTDLLPGTSRATVILPFGPFVYKNAGAAALVPGLAATVGLLWVRWMSATKGQVQSHRSGGSKSTFGYGRSAIFAEQRTMILMLLCGLIVAGLLMSYSRGAWLAVFVATVMILALTRKLLSTRMIAVFVVSPVVVCLGIVAATGGFHRVSNTIENQLSADYVYADARWEHWQDGFRSAKKFFPVGSGLGTYGYATLSEQKYDTILWFREAHNHYLETLAEQGLPGLILLLLGGAWITRIGVKLLFNPASRERASIGVVGLIAIVAIAVQSIFDFVILIPAVMFAFAALFGMVAHFDVLPVKRVRRIRTTEGAGGESERKLSSMSIPALWAIPVLVGLVWAITGLWNQVSVEDVLADTIVPSESVPSEKLIESNLDRLTACIAVNPRQPNLYQRRAQWHTMRLRIGIAQASERDGDRLDWAATDPSILFQKIMSLPTVKRNLLADDFAINSSLRQPIKSAIADLQRSIELNPFVAKSHLSIAYLAPAANLDQRPFFESMCRLSHSSGSLQFAIGLIAYFAGDQSTMIDQWRRSLRIHTTAFPKVVQLCRESMTLTEFISNVIPDNGSGWFIPMIRALDETDLNALTTDPELIEVLENRVASDPSMNLGQQQALLGWIWTELKHPQRRVQHWHAAVQADRASAEYRYQYCQSLIQVGDYEEAMKQAALGLSLDDDRNRFRLAAESAHRALRKQTAENRSFDDFNPVSLQQRQQ